MLKRECENKSTAQFVKAKSLVEVTKEKEIKENKIKRVKTNIAGK